MFELSVVLYKNNNKTLKIDIEKQEKELKEKISPYFWALTDGRKTTVTYSSWKTARIVFYVNDNKGIPLLVKKNKYRDMSEIFEIDNVYDKKIKIFFYPRRIQFFKGIKTIIISN